MNTLVRDVLDFHENPDSARNSPFDFDTIFKKYFPIEDKDNVLKMFNRIRTKNRRGYFLLDLVNFFATDQEYGYGTPDGVIAYVKNPVLASDPTQIDRSIPGEMYFCVGGQTDFFLIPLLEDKRCPISTVVGQQQRLWDADLDALDTWVSNSMVTMGHFQLHESLCVSFLFFFSPNY